MTPKVTQLIEKLETIHAKLQDLIVRLKRLDKVIGEAVQASMATTRLADLLTQLYELLVALHATLIVLGNVPYVNVVAKPLDQVVHRIKDQVQNLKQQLDRLESMIQPLRRALSELRATLAEALRPVVRMDDFIAQELSQLEIASAAADGLPNGRYKRAQQAQLGQLADKLTGALNTPLRSLSSIEERLNELTPLVDKAMDASEEVLRSVKLFTDLMAGVQGTKEDAKSLDEALSQKINFGGEQMSLKDLLESVGELPEEVMETLKSLLDTPLQQLKSSMGLRLPDPIAIIMCFQTIQRQFDAVRSALDAAAAEINEVADPSNLPKSFGKIAG